MRNHPLPIDCFHLTAFAAGCIAFASPAWGQVYAGGEINEDIQVLGDGDEAGYFDLFGYSVAIDNNTLAVGALRDDINGTSSGSVSLFDPSTGTLLFKLLPSDGAAYDQFGCAIAIDNGIVAIGAHENDDNGSASGSAYLFDASTGTQTVKLLPNDGAQWDWFGRSIAIADGIVVVGAPRDADKGINAGSAYLFDANTGVQLAKLLPPNKGQNHHDFGTAVAISNGIVAVGAPGATTPNGYNSGTVYLFDAITGTPISQITPNDGASRDQFGWSVSIDGGIVAIGAPYDDEPIYLYSGKNLGSVYLFDVTTNNQITKLVPEPNYIREGSFGHSVAINNGVILVGARYRYGTAYLYDTSNHAQIGQFIPNDGRDSWDQTGSAVALRNGIAVIGSPFDSTSGGISTGSAYVMTVPDPICTADLNGNGTYDIFDVNVFLIAYNNNDLTVDFNNDGVIDILDAFAFLQAYLAGCP